MIFGPGRPDPALAALGQLREELQEGLRTQTLRIDEEPDVVAAITWLTSCRRSDACWGEQQDGTTGLAVLALTAWSDLRRAGVLSPATEAARAFDARPTANWIARRADSEGKWLTPWYTGIAVQALVAAQYRGGELRRGVDYLLRLNPDNEQYWRDRTHHAAQVLSALAAVRADGEVLASWEACVMHHASSRLSPYVCGQAVHCLLRHTNRSHEEVRHLVEPLAAYLDATDLSKSAFIDHASALRALAVAKSVSRETQTLVASKARELFSRTERGSWYRDAEMTAWALLALHEVGSVTQVTVDQVSFNSAFSTATRQVSRGQRTRARETAVLTALLLVLAAGIALIAVLNPVDSVFITGVVLVSLVAGAGASLRELVTRLSPAGS